MIGLDTNILVRYLAQDDPIQSPLATDIFEFRLTQENPGFISVVAMVETVWVLDLAHGLADHEIAAVLDRILQADTLVVESEQELFTAAIALKDGRGSFADALIGALGNKAGCSATLTIDKRALRLSLLTIPKPYPRPVLRLQGDLTPAPVLLEHLPRGTILGQAIALSPNSVPPPPALFVGSLKNC